MVMLAPQSWARWATAADAAMVTVCDIYDARAVARFVPRVTDRSVHSPCRFATLGSTLNAAHHSVDRFEQFVGVDRFGHVRIHTGLEASAVIFLHGVGGQGDDG